MYNTTSRFFRIIHPNRPVRRAGRLDSGADAPKQRVCQVGSMLGYRQRYDLSPQQFELRGEKYQF